jgi:hypothetical protein
MAIAGFESIELMKRCCDTPQLPTLPKLITYSIDALVEARNRRLVHSRLQ